jgi:DNA-binding NarL/FixJ family response regulator
MKPISVALIDDHPLLLAGVANLFEESDGFEIVARGASAGDALKIVTQRPDVIILDLNMPGNAFDAISVIAANSADTKVVAFTASTGVDHAVRALKAGASGYILKGSSAQELIRGIRAVHAGEMYITQDFAAKGRHCPAQCFVTETFRTGRQAQHPRGANHSAPDAWTDEQGDRPRARHHRENREALHDDPDAKAAGA